MKNSLRFAAFVGMLALVIPSSLTARTLIFSTFAGKTKVPGALDGAGAEARFRNPGSVAINSAGTTYVSDNQNHIIRRISTNGVVTTLAGFPGVSGSADGTNTTARFSAPAGITTDAAGNIYIADKNNHTIRKIDTLGLVSTLAGLAGQSGTTDGTGNAARFSFPSGIAVDAAGNLYVADSGNNTVRKITAAGVVTTLAGVAGTTGATDGAGAVALFNLPTDVAANAAGTVFIADTFNHAIRMITPAGVVSTLAGTAGTPGSTDGAGAAAKFFLPQGVALDAAGNIIVADTENRTLRNITPTGVVTTIAGAPGIAGANVDGADLNARFYSPVGIAVYTNGIIAVTDIFDHTIRRGTPPGLIAVTNAEYRVTTLAGLAGQIGLTDAAGSLARFNQPRGIALSPGGTVFVADTVNNAIRAISPTGIVSTFAANAGLNAPQGMVVDSAGNLYVADSGNEVIRKITPTSVVSIFAGQLGVAGGADGISTAATFNRPVGLSIDGLGNLYVADQANHTIRKISPQGIVGTLAGLAGQMGFADGTGNAARFKEPTDVAVDSAGIVYVADTDNHVVRKITPTGVVTTLVGAAGLNGTVDGTGNAARFDGPSGLALDGGGNLYVSDLFNHTIRKVSPSAVVTTIVGNAGVIGATDGIGTNATFHSPYHLASDRFGNLFIADITNSVIRKATPIWASRVLPPRGYWPTLNVLVTINAVPPTGATSFAVEDSLPRGTNGALIEATVSAINNGGVFEAVNSKIKFGPYFDDLPRTLVYQLTMPARTAGLLTWEGVISIEGVDFTIGGSNILDHAPLHPADHIVHTNNIIDINEVTAYASAWNAGAIWDVEPNPIPIAYLTRAGAIWKGGEFYAFIPPLSSAPLCWQNTARPVVSLPSTGTAIPIPARQSRFQTTSLLPASPGGTAVSTMAGTFTPLQTHRITINVSPQPSVRAYAVEDHFPSGWTASNLSAGGVVDLINNKVKWGPYLDAVPRTFTYDVMAPVNTTGSASFIGVVSFDGTGASVSGQRQTLSTAPPQPQLLGATTGANNQFQMNLTGTLNQVWVIQVSTNLVNWTPLFNVTNTLGSIQILDNTAADYPRRFYRAVAP